MDKKSYLLGVLIIIAACTQQNTVSGDGYFENGEYQKAIEVYSDYLKTNQSHINTRYNRGRAYEELGEIELASNDFKEIIKIDPKNISAYLSLAKLAYTKENFNSVLVYSNKALELNDNSAQANFLAARGAHKLGYFDMALESYNNAITVNKDFGEAYLYRGALKISIEKIRSACEDFSAANRLNVSGARKAMNDFCK